VIRQVDGSRQLSVLPQLPNCVSRGNKGCYHMIRSPRDVTHGGPGIQVLWVVRIPSHDTQVCLIVSPLSIGISRQLFTFWVCLLPHPRGFTLYIHLYDSQVSQFIIVLMWHFTPPVVSFQIHKSTECCQEIPQSGDSRPVLSPSQHTLTILTRPWWDLSVWFCRRSRQMRVFMSLDLTSRSFIPLPRFVRVLLPNVKN
jgi:hypothetical protein